MRAASIPSRASRWYPPATRSRYARRSRRGWLSARVRPGGPRWHSRAARPARSRGDAVTFTTLTFLLFSVLVFALHWRARGRRGQNLVVLAASYVFYGWWDPRFCTLLLASSLVDFWIG